MGFFKRMFGICRTKPPADSTCWSVDGGTVRVDLTRAAELGAPGGAIRLEGPGLPKPVLIFRGDDGEIHAFPNVCTHGGRRLDPLPGQSTVQCCSVGKSTFDYVGKRLSGSAKDDIEPLAAALDGDHLAVTLPPARS